MSFKGVWLRGASVDFAPFRGALPSPSTAYVCDWNLQLIGQVLWMEELATYRRLLHLSLLSDPVLERAATALVVNGLGWPNPCD